ncbi:unnamed protein product [Lampetra planeri]
MGGEYPQRSPGASLRLTSPQSRDLVRRLDRWQGVVEGTPLSRAPCPPSLRELLARRICLDLLCVVYAGRIFVDGVYANSDWGRVDLKGRLKSNLI